jgi:hypothetical protein
MLEKHAYLFFKKEKKLSDQRLSASQILTITNSKLRGIFTGKKKHYSALTFHHGLTMLFLFLFWSLKFCFRQFHPFWGQNKI